MTHYDEGLDPSTARWLRASKFLEPEASIQRLIANGKYVAASVTAVTAALTVVGVAQAGVIIESPIAQWTAALAGLLAAVSILLAYLPFVLRVKPVNVENLQEVRSWFEAQFRKGRLITAAGACLVAAMVAAIATAVLIAVPPQRQAPTMSMALVGVGPHRELTVLFDLGPAPAAVNVTLSVEAKSGTRQILLLQQTAHVAGGAPFRVSWSIATMARYGCFDMTGSYGGRSSRLLLGCAS